MEDIAGLPSRLPPQERTLSRMLRRQAARHGARRLVQIGGQTWSFNETLDMAARFGGTLKAAGIKRGDHVAVMCGNRPELLQVYLGCGWIGAVAVPINTASRGAQLAHILSNSQAKLLVAQADFASAVEGSRSRAAVVARDLADRRRGFFQTLAAASCFPTAHGAGAGSLDRTRRYVAILYTSGTTGVSKGVCCPHAQYFLVGREHRAIAWRA
jgi:crotonobetaine/carnitine-CoA ligase